MRQKASRSNSARLGRGAEGARDPSITGHFAEIIRMQMRADDIAGRKESSYEAMVIRPRGEISTRHACLACHLHFPKFFPSSLSSPFRSSEFYSWWRFLLLCSLIFFRNCEANCKGRSKYYVSKLRIKIFW